VKSATNPEPDNLSAYSRFEFILASNEAGLQAKK